MLFATSRVILDGSCRFPSALLMAFLISVSLPTVSGQSAVDYTGTGGRHTIQGRIYFPSGRQADAPGLKVKLESMSTGALSIITDSNGSFTFKNLAAGSYTIVIEGDDNYETVREAVYIDDPGGSSMRGRVSVGSTPRIFMVPIYLMPRRHSDKKPAVLVAALATAPKEAADLYLKALELSAAGDHKKAIAQLKSALLLYPDFALALNELGVQYLRTGEPNKAVEPLATAVRLSPEDFQARLHYGIALLNQMKFGEAEEQFTTALKKNNAAPVAHMYLGITQLSQKKLDQAQKELETAVSSSSREVGLAHRYLGGIYWGKRDYQRAAGELETYLKMMPAAADAERTRIAIKELRNKQ